MKRKRLIIFLFSFVLGITSLYLIATRPQAHSHSLHLRLGREKIKAEIADTPPERAIGLSGRKSLPKNQGMLFVFETPDKYSFWMKDMLFPIDIIWIGEDKKVVEITKNVSPDSFPQTFQPKEPVLYVLEVNAGFAKEKGLKVGDELSF